MSEDVTAKLARFTPTGLDRDATLFTTGFAAGRAAGRRGVWKWLTAALVVSNVLTLTALVWPRPTADEIVNPARLTPPAEGSDESPAGYPPPAPFSYSALLQNPDARGAPAVGDDAPRLAPLTPRSWDDPRFN
jgi:hypothetical protein